MIRRLLTTLVFAVTLLASGCLQRTNADLPVQGSHENYNVKWTLVGTFGGPAPKLAAGADPWTTRYEPGQFREISGVCATDDEVWVCDLGVSRIQVFDFDGNYLREIGEGVPLESLLPTDEELYAQGQTSRKKMRSWEDYDAGPWVGQEGRLFKASDVVPSGNGCWLADQMRSSYRNYARRWASCYFVTPTGMQAGTQSKMMCWPSYLAVEGNVIACSDTVGNYLWMGIPQDKQWKTKSVTSDPSFSGIMRAKTAYAGTPQEELQVMMASGASTEPGKFNMLGGIAIAYDKLVACDMVNRRLQVFDARPEPAAHWGTLIRVIPREHPRQGQRFDVPTDIDISSDGLIFLLDAGRREVVLLNPRFERIGAFGLGDLASPYAIDISDDGRDCFITDSDYNKVFHYAVSD